MTTRNINNTNTGLKAFRYNPSLNVIRPTPISPARLDNFVATHKSIFCHANLQLVLETFSHTQQASKYSQSNGAETALTFYQITRSKTAAAGISSQSDLGELARQLLVPVFPVRRGVRLLGVTLSSLGDVEPGIQPQLDLAL